MKNYEKLEIEIRILDSSEVFTIDNSGDVATPEENWPDQAG